MSVAERVPLDETLTPFATQAAASTIDNIIRLALNNVTEARPAASPAKRSDPDFGMAAGLLDRATTTLAALTQQRDALEVALARQQEAFARHEALLTEKLERMQAEAAEWERRAKIIKAQMQDSETRLADQQVKIDGLTFRAENAEARVAFAERIAQDAQDQAQMYHDRIVATFSDLA